MTTTKVFQSGNSQDVAEVEIERHGDELVLRPLARNLSAAFAALADIPEDFFAEGRQDTLPQTRACRHAD